MTETNLTSAVGLRPFDLVILDVDGTIYEPPTDGSSHDASGRHLGFDSEIVETIAAIHALGIPVTIASGRTLEFIHVNLFPMGITKPVVSTQGAIVGDPATGLILRREGFTREDARTLAAWVDEGERLCAFYFVDEHGRNTILQNFDTPANAYYDAIIGVPRHTHSPFASLLESDDSDLPVKLLMVSDQVAEAALPAELQARFGPGVHVGRTHPSLIEVTTEGVDKGSGVKHLCELLGVDPARVLAIGDNDNDVPMFKQVGFPVAMGNGSPNAKAAASWVAPDIHNHGAVVALRKFVLGIEP